MTKIWRWFPYGLYLKTLHKLVNSNFEVANNHNNLIDYSNFWFIGFNSEIILIEMVFKFVFFSILFRTNFIKLANFSYE